MFNLAKRNFKLYIRDKGAVFFSLLGALIMISLYVLFLGNTIISGDMEKLPQIRFLTDSWMIAGVICVSTITTTLGALGIMVDDITKKTRKDFSASPLKRYQIVGGYVLNSVAVGIFMSLLTFLVGEIYILADGGKILPVLGILKISGVIVLSVLASSSLTCFLVSFFKTSGAFSNASIVLGTLIGFITGSYIPVGSLPEAVGWVIKLFPLSHAAALFRQIMTADIIPVTFAGAPEIAAEFSAELGVTLEFGANTLSWPVHIAVLLGTAVLFYGLAIFRLAGKKRS
ncbi:ABC transporter permease [Anaerolentibacter hominis]|uniref:ABC transporter permease n=1 Tax=Anaerolentibacter hominis TaxID=3079009 RepID=UPI0031B8213A